MPELRSTVSINQARRVVDMSKTIALLEPSKTPFMSLMSRVGKQATHNTIFNWLEDGLQGRWDAVNLLAGYDADATDIVVDTGALFAAGDVVKVPRTGEALLVVSVTTNTLTVVRGYGVTAAAALVDNDPLVIIGQAYLEGSLSATPRTINTTTVSNYTQIFKTSVKVTKTQEATKLYGGADRAYQRKKKAIEHAIDISRTAWFGEKKEAISGETVRRTTAGVLNMLGSSVPTYDASGSLTEANFEKLFMEQAFQYGSKTKVMFASPRVISVINSWGKDKMQVDNMSKEYGLAIMRYESAHGTLKIVREPLFEGAIYGKMGVVLDLENVKYRPLNGRDTKLETNIEAPDEDCYKDQYITEAGCELKLPKTHAVLKGVDFPA
jgi:hypothetical protein